MTRTTRALCASILVVFASVSAQADLPAAKEAMQVAGFSEAQIQQVLAGKLVRRTPEAGSERELTTMMAFLVEAPPAQVMSGLQKGLAAEHDSAALGGGEIASAEAETLPGLRFESDELDDYGSAEAGDAMNLSTQELAALAAASDGDAAATTRAVHGHLLERHRSYRSGGLAGIEHYDRGDGDKRSAAEELRTATRTLKGLEKYVPEFYQLLLDYPAAKPPGFGERYRWRKIDAHGTPTVVLDHTFWMPSGSGFAAAERQYYVSRGFNAEQAVAVLLPAGKDTVVVYVNRTSTDQVTGFGGGTKRSLGSKLMASQLETIWQGFRGAAGGP